MTNENHEVKTEIGWTSSGDEILNRVHRALKKQGLNDRMRDEIISSLRNEGIEFHLVEGKCDNGDEEAEA